MVTVSYKAVDVFKNIAQCLSGIDKFSDLKNLNISTETKIYRPNWKQRAKISITAKFEEEILSPSQRREAPFRA